MELQKRTVIGKKIKKRNYFLNKMDPETVFYGVLAFMWLEFLWEAYLSKRQRKIYRENTKIPADLVGILDNDTFTKARLYALDKSNFGAVQGVFNQIMSTALIWFFAFKYLWDMSGNIVERCGYEAKSNEILTSMAFILLTNIFNTIVGQPFSIYNTFVLEERHGFNKQTGAFYAWDQLKKFLVAQIISLPIVGIIIKIIHWGGEFFFIYLWAFVVGFTLFMMIIYPEFIAPLFDKYTPLPDGSLKSDIEALAASIGFPLYKLFVVEGSKRSSHSNAYFYGFFKWKRIVLFDTLLEESEREKLKSEDEKEKEVKPENEEEEKKAQGCTNDEILAVLGHELGHWKLNHVLKNLVIAEVHIFAMFALFGYLYRNQMLYTAFGFKDEMPVLIGLMIILQFITAPYNALLDFAMTTLSRHFEFQADEFASKQLNRADKLSSALVKLNNDNLGFPIFDWLYSAWHHSHPPLLERLNALKSDKKSN